MSVNLGKRYLNRTKTGEFFLNTSRANQIKMWCVCVCVCRKRGGDTILQRKACTGLRVSWHAPMPSLPHQAAGLVPLCSHPLAQARASVREMIMIPCVCVCVSESIFQKNSGCICKEQAAREGQIGL